MTAFHDQDFVGQQVTLDGNEFSGCKFEQCEVRYCGAADVKMMTNKVINSQWVFLGPAGSTLKMLRAMYHGGFRQQVEEAFAVIRTPPEET